MVAAGLGVSLLPGLAAPSAPAGVRVLRVIDRQWSGRATVVVTPARRSRRAKAMVDALQEQAGHLTEASGDAVPP